MPNLTTMHFAGDARDLYAPFAFRILMEPKARQHRIPGLHLQGTTEDPEMFFEPFTYDRHFVVVPVSFETGCAANNRDDGRSPVDLTPPEGD